ncbi:DUF2946 domain-containing protein [Mitsuaria sp. 7]|uniref:DUF2946 domain-containing protein n=1 Tax=Mitsuaria sp. 7 TaxID=1658665 RepID=UPI0007DD7E4B|nr:DUF2946 domain-containing protein [Mitsuaria sp. 7]ANH68082.1 hypothetical protein ABE85_11750 [Mitsuaria sp. 7]
MQATRTSIRRWAWLVSFTILLAAMLPSLSQAMLVHQGASFAEICSATGAKLVVIGADGNVDTSRDSASLMSSSMNCPYCAIHHGAPDLPPATVQWTPPDALKFERPQLFFTAPRPLFAWAPSLARGPPAVA